MNKARLMLFESEYIAFLVTSFNVPYSMSGEIMIYDQVGIDWKDVSIMTVVKKTKVVNSYGYYIFKIDDGRHTE